jgi:hypothetical protein
MKPQWEETALLVEKWEEESWSLIPMSTVETWPGRSGNTPLPLWLEVTFESCTIAVVLMWTRRPSKIQGPIQDSFFGQNPVN